MFNRAAAAVAISLLCAVPAHAGLQLYEGSWMVKAFGNERTGGTGESEFYSAIGIPLGQQCNDRQPRCPFESTPTDGKGNIRPLGGGLPSGPAIFCAPIYNFSGMGTTMRLTRFAYGSESPRWPLRDGIWSRNPAFFTPSGAPNTAHCDPRWTSHGGYGSLGGAPGIAQAGSPINGQGIANTAQTQSNPRRFSIAAARSRTESGIRGTRTGDLPFEFPTIYRYTYAELRNAKGVFGPDLGPGSFSISYQSASKGAIVAKLKVKQGAAKFGGTMKMLGQLTTKVCYYRNGGCSLGRSNWLYEAIGAAAYTSAGEVTKGYQAKGSSVFFNSGLGQWSTVMAYGSRFPWTTGSVTVTAVGRGPHKTVHYGMGYDNRTPASGKGTIQLVSPTMTRWLLPGDSDDTAGIAILRIEFLPEPRAWAMLVAGMSALAVAYRWRSR